MFIWFVTSRHCITSSISFYLLKIGILFSHVGKISVLQEHLMLGLLRCFAKLTTVLSIRRGQGSPHAALCCFVSLSTALFLEQIKQNWIWIFAVQKQLDDLLNLITTMQTQFRLNALTGTRLRQRTELHFFHLDGCNTEVRSRSNRKYHLTLGDVWLFVCNKMYCRKKKEHRSLCRRTKLKPCR